MVFIAAMSLCHLVCIMAICCSTHALISVQAVCTTCCTYAAWHCAPCCVCCTVCWTVCCMVCSTACCVTCSICAVCSTVCWAICTMLAIWFCDCCHIPFWIPSNVCWAVGCKRRYICSELSGTGTKVPAWSCGVGASLIGPPTAWSATASPSSCVRSTISVSPSTGGWELGSGRSNVAPSKPTAVGCLVSNGLDALLVAPDPLYDPLSYPGGGGVAAGVSLGVSTTMSLPAKIIWYRCKSSASVVSCACGFSSCGCALTGVPLTMPMRTVLLLMARPSTCSSTLRVRCCPSPSACLFPSVCSSASNHCHVSCRSGVSGRLPIGTSVALVVAFDSGLAEGPVGLIIGVDIPSTGIALMSVSDVMVPELVVIRVESLGARWHSDPTSTSFPTCTACPSLHSPGVRPTRVHPSPCVHASDRTPSNASRVDGIAPIRSSRWDARGASGCVETPGA